MLSKVPSCAFSGFLTLKLTQHFDLIYNIDESDWNILRNIMKTAINHLERPDIVEYHENRST